MKNYFIVAAVLFVPGIIMYSCSGNSTETDQAGTTQVVSGAEIYKSNCVICHGQDGKAQLAGATDLSKSTLTHDAAVHVVTHGRNGMRGFTELTALFHT
jgi:mono/diheme cytochrome c family protein